MRDELVKHFLEPIVKHGVDIALNKTAGIPMPVREVFFGNGYSYKPIGSDVKTLKYLMRESLNDSEFSEDDLTTHVENLVVFFDGNQPVGYFNPKVERSSGRYRSGTVFILPKFRNKGYGTIFVKEFFKDKTGKVMIFVNNTPSIKMYTASGFRKSGKRIFIKGDAYDEYLKG